MLVTRINIPLQNSGNILSMAYSYKFTKTT